MTLILATACTFLVSLGGASDPAPVTFGVDVLLGPRTNEYLNLLSERRVGLLTHSAAVDGRLVATADRLAGDPRVNLVQLYAPEHGIRGALKAGESVPDGVDPVTKLPVQALWGKRRRPTPASLKKIDVLLIDLQTLGSRTYTFESTLGETLIAAAAANVPVLVLDRPNPLGGLSMQGPIVPPPKRPTSRRSMVGWGPVPVTHGMTVGEIARFYNGVLSLGCDLHVVPMRGWRREMTWEDTGHHWIPTSPGIPHVRNAHLYVATGMIGGVTANINEGVGTTMPFETIAATFIDPPTFTDALNARSLPGVLFRPINYRPYYHRHRGQTLGGVQLIVTDPAAFRPLLTAVTILTEIQALYPGRIAWRKPGYVRRIWAGTDLVASVTRGQQPASIVESWDARLAEFKRLRAPHLLYPAAAPARRPPAPPATGPAPRE